MDNRDYKDRSDGIDRRGMLKCMAWVGTGVVWTLRGGIPTSRVFGQDSKDTATGDTTHCDMHFSGTNTITVTHSNVTTAYFGLMLYGGTNANFTFDNWLGNINYDVFTEAGTPVTADFSNGWFEKGPPHAAAGSSFRLDNLATARVTDAGPRP